MNKEFYDGQVELIDITISILSKELYKYKNNEKYSKFFYDKKNVPSHILQPLLSLKNKIILKPVYNKIQNDLNISHHKAKKLIEYYGFSFILNNLEKIKELLEKMPFSKVNRDIYILIK